MAQDRRDCLVQDQSILDNMMMATIAKGAGVSSLNVAERRRVAISLMKKLQIKAESVDAEMRTLSGGNQQKVQVARWLAAGARILLLIDPTRGVDVGARTEITRIWGELADAGCAILLVSSDAEEIVEICDRAVVLRNGRFAGEVERTDLSEARLVKLAAGV